MQLRRLFRLGCLGRELVSHASMPTRRLGVFHCRFVLPVLIVMRGLQVMMRRGLILRGRLKVVAVLAAMVSA